MTSIQFSEGLLLQLLGVKPTEDVGEHGTEPEFATLFNTQDMQQATAPAVPWSDAPSPKSTTLPELPKVLIEVPAQNSERLVKSEPVAPENVQITHKPAPETRAEAPVPDIPIPSFGSEIALTKPPELSDTSPVTAKLPNENADGIELSAPRGFTPLPDSKGLPGPAEAAGQQPKAGPIPELVSVTHGSGPSMPTPIQTPETGHQDQLPPPPASRQPLANAAAVPNVDTPTVPATEVAAVQLQTDRQLPQPKAQPENRLAEKEPAPLPSLVPRSAMQEQPPAPVAVHARAVQPVHAPQSSESPPAFLNAAPGAPRPKEVSPTNPPPPLSPLPNAIAPTSHVAVLSAPVTFAVPVGASPADASSPPGADVAVELPTELSTEPTRLAKAATDAPLQTVGSAAPVEPKVMIADPLAPKPKVDVTEGLGARPTATSVDAPPLTSATMEPRALAQQSAVPTASASPMPVAAQVSSALSSSTSDVIELTLQPEELGRVRLSLNPSDAGISVAVTAERAETLDLIRRHLDQLSQDLRQQGYRDVRFDFGQNMQDRPQSPPNPQFQDAQEQPSEPIYAETVPQSAQVHLTIGVSTGVDIRL